MGRAPRACGAWPASLQATNTMHWTKDNTSVTIRTVAAEVKFALRDV